jgi:hypothetical protein
MAEKFPKTSAGVPNAQLNFEKPKEMKMRAFVADFMKEYDSTGLPSAGVSRIMFGRLGAFLHLALFMAWSDVICNNEKPPIDFPVDCLVGKYALPVIYYVLDGRSSAPRRHPRLLWTTGFYFLGLRQGIPLKNVRPRA